MSVVPGPPAARFRAWALAAGAAGFAALLAALPVRADLLGEVRARGELVAGVRDAAPPFGFIPKGELRLAGYDVDIAAAIARRLGARLRTVPVTPATRIRELAQGRVDLLAAAMTRTREREEQIDFSHAYFVTGQKVLVRRSGGIAKLSQLAGRKVGFSPGSLAEDNIRRAVPGVETVPFDDSELAFQALSQGRIDAVTSDETHLLRLKQKAPDPGAYRLLDKFVSVEPYALGIRKGEPAFRREVNRILVELEKSGEAAQIYNAWFGPDSALPLKRAFRIEPEPAAKPTEARP